MGSGTKELSTMETRKRPARPRWKKRCMSALWWCGAGAAWATAARVKSARVWRRDDMLWV
jgi:hypothetical protein